MAAPREAAPGIPASAPGVPPGIPWLHEAWEVMHGRGTPRLGRDRVRLIGRLDRALPVSLPWCGAFVGHCVKSAAPQLRLPRTHARARPWLNWGEPARPQLGALLVFWHWRPWGVLGHVAFYWAEDEAAYHVLGGNQRDRILIQRYPKHRLLGSRWVTGVAAPGLTRAAAPAAAVPFDGDWRLAG
jgi:uncharacterized protein (TIGR02594 family)